MGQQGFPILAAALADPSPRRVIEKISRHICVAGAPTPPRAQTNKQIWHASFSMEAGDATGDFAR
jgi:hypothetical protein